MQKFSVIQYISGDANQSSEKWSVNRQAQYHTYVEHIREGGLGKITCRYVLAAMFATDDSVVGKKAEDVRVWETEIEDKRAGYLPLEASVEILLHKPPWARL